MPTEAKRETIDELRAELDASRTMIVSEYRGLKVKEISEIRRALRKQDVTYRVVKNRLMRIAAQDNAAAEALSPAPRGPDGDRLRHRRGRRRRRPSSTRRARTTGSSGSRAACWGRGRSTPTA